MRYNVKNKYERKFPLRNYSTCGKNCDFLSLDFATPREDASTNHDQGDLNTLHNLRRSAEVHIPTGRQSQMINFGCNWTNSFSKWTWSDFKFGRVKMNTLFAVSPIRVHSFAVVRDSDGQWMVAADNPFSSIKIRGCNDQSHPIPKKMNCDSVFTSWGMARIILFSTNCMMTRTRPVKSVSNTRGQLFNRLDMRHLKVDRTSAKVNPQCWISVTGLVMWVRDNSSRILLFCEDTKQAEALKQCSAPNRLSALIKN